MPRRSRLRDLQRDWNQLAPIGRAHGLTLRDWNALPAAAWVAQERLDWLRNQLVAFGVDLNNLPITQVAPVALLTGDDAFMELFTFGAEIECILPEGVSRARIANMLTTEAGIETRHENYNHHSRTWWKTVHDLSLDSPRGCELVSPILKGALGLEQLRKVCEFLDSKNVRVNSRCGFHVHVGARNRSVNFWHNLLKLYAHFEPALDTITAPSRRGNSNRYARSTQAKMARYAAQLEGHQNVEAFLHAYDAHHGDSITRFEKVNLCAYWRHGTVEFRQHQGTINADKASNWVKLCLRLAQAAVENKVADGEQTLNGLAAKLAMPARELAFFSQRATQLTRILRNERT